MFEVYVVDKDAFYMCYGIYRGSFLLWDKKESKWLYEEVESCVPVPEGVDHIKMRIRYNNK